jgi:hypothetical protein
MAISSKTRDQIREMRRQNYSYVDIAHETLVDPKTVEYYAKDIPVPARRGNRYNAAIYAADLKLLAAWMAAGPSGRRAVAERFGLPKSTAWYRIQRVRTHLAALQTGPTRKAA